MTFWKGIVRSFARADRARPAILLILLLAFALRIYRLGDKNIWWDEGLAVWAVRKGLSEATLWTAGDVHPPLYFWCLWVWRQLVGESEFALRYLTLAFGVLTVAATYALGRRLAGQRVALLGGFLLAIARFHVWWSQEMRMYVLAGLMGTLAWYFLLRAMGNRGLELSRAWRGVAGRWLAYVLVAAASMYTVYLSVASVIAQNLFVLAVGLARKGRERWRLWGLWALAQLAVLLLFLPWLALALPRMRSWSVVQAPVSLRFVLQLAASLFTLGASTHLARYALVVLPFVVICAAGLGLLVGQRPLSEGARSETGPSGRSEGAPPDLAETFAALSPRLHSASQPTMRPGGRGVQLRSIKGSEGAPPDLAETFAALSPRLHSASQPTMRPGGRGVQLRSIKGSEAGPGGGDGELHGWQSSLLFLLALGIPTLSAWLLTQPRAVFYTPRIEARYFVPFATLFYVLLGWSLLLIMQRVKPLGLVALTFVVAVFAWTVPEHFKGRYLRDELQSMVRTIWAYARPGDTVLLVSGDRYPLFRYYYDRAPAPQGRPPVVQLPHLSEVVTPETVGLELDAPLDGHPRLWLAAVEAAIQDPDGLLEAWLDQHRPTALSLAFGHNRLKLYTDRLEPLAVRPASSGPQHLVEADLAQGVRLWGYDLPAREYGPGDTVHLALYWDLDQPADVFVALTKELGQTWEEHRLSLQPLQGGILRTQSDFAIWPRTPGGDYAFDVRAQTRASASSPSERLAVGRFRVRDTVPLPVVSAITHPMSVPLGGGVSFLGYDLRRQDGSSADSVRPGEVIHLDLYWQVREKVSQRYTVFTHLVGEAYNPKTLGPVWAQHDGEPVEGGFPTHQWPVGMTVRDSHVLEIDPAAPAGTYRLHVGMYLLSSGERLPVLGNDGRALDDHIVLQAIQVGS